MPNIAAPTLRGQLDADFMHSPLKQVGASLLFRAAGNLAQSLIQDPSLKTHVSSALFLGSVLTTAAAIENFKSTVLEPASSFNSPTDKLLHMSTTIATAFLARLNGAATAGELIAPEMKAIFTSVMGAYDAVNTLEILNGLRPQRQEAARA